MKNQTKTLITALFALVVWFALGLQFYISIEKNLAMGHSLGYSVVFLLSYYTIQTNLLVAVSLTSLLKPNSVFGRFFSRVSVLTAIAVYILIVGLVYNTVLKGLVKLEGLFILADYLLHTVSPLLYVVYWVIFAPRKYINWNKLLPWACFPLLYLVYALIRGALTNLYPYFFVNAAKYGYKQVFINSFFVLLVFLVLGAIFISLNNFISKKQTNHAANLL